MRQEKRPPHVGTIGSSLRVGHGIAINCENRDCRHRATLDLNKLRASLGEGYAIADLVARSVCSECGSRWPQLSLTVSPVSSPRVVRSPP